jgi:hypothetical protein
VRFFDIALHGDVELLCSGTGVVDNAIMQCTHHVWRNIVDGRAGLETVTEKVKEAEKE